MDIRDEIILRLKEVMVKIFTVDLEPQLAFSNEMKFGDYSTNIAMVAWGSMTPQIRSDMKKQGIESPMTLADKIVFSFRAEMQNVGLIKKIEVVKPGFINFWLDDKMLFDSLIYKMHHSDTIGRLAFFSGKKIMIEFTDPNPFKEFHIGHLYDNIVGESLSRLLEAGGAEVWRVTYQGDVGLHVAKSIYGMLRKLESSNSVIGDLASKSLTERAQFLGESYALGAKAYDEDAHAKDEITTINKKVYTKEDAFVNELYKEGRQWSLAYFGKIYKRLGSDFKKNYFESEAAPLGLAFVREHMKLGIFRESNGAIVFPEEISGLHTRVFINSQGLPTYEAKELGLAPAKYEDFPYDISIILTGNEVDEYFKVLLKALSLINSSLAKKTIHLSHGMVRLPEGKMSSRTGNVLTGEGLLDEATEKALKKIQEVVKSSIDTNLTERKHIADLVGIGAVKYALLKTSIGKDISFSFDESISFEGNSGPYLQYTYVRIRSVLNKISDFSPQSLEFSINFDFVKEESDLLRWVMRFEGVVADAAKRYSPNILCTYLFELAQLFNLFYQKCSILKADVPVRDFRLALIMVVSLIIKRGLELLGIETPEKM